jgi:hypothetical protein
MIGMMGTGVKGVGTFSTIIRNLQDVFKATGLQLLALFTIINFIKMAMDIDRVSWEKVVMVFVRFMIFKTLIQYASRLFAAIFQIGDVLMEQIQTTLTLSVDASNTMTAAEAIKEAINNPDIDLGWSLLNNGASLIVFIIFLFCLLPYIGTMLSIVTSVLYRCIKIVLYVSIAPIPIAIGSFEDGASTGKRFIMQAAGMVLEGLMIMIILYLYQIGIASIPAIGSDGSNVLIGAAGFMIAVMLMNSLCSLAISQSAQMAERWAGA